ncbi:metallophosphoesterase mpped2 isoform x2 [Limosa lapponica baueri]|uniref:Metallophosphoesterase mpped2 isoform x2 n=1 Tax=Limosa lapponica baueri TaxID=1758121 RepID=A0A2I0TC42_LIMLA|nr:metallophosphoesterase mpped2 isoform x2 [Limosa lapponica baueri]
MGDLGNLPYEYKIVIAGNHELTFDKEFMADLVKQDYYRFPSVSKLKPEDFDNVQSLLTNSIYLQDSEVTVKGFRIYGAPCWPGTRSFLPFAEHWNNTVANVAFVCTEQTESICNQ